MPTAYGGRFVWVQKLGYRFGRQLGKTPPGVDGYNRGFMVGVKIFVWGKLSSSTQNTDGDRGDRDKAKNQRPVHTKFLGDLN